MTITSNSNLLNNFTPKVSAAPIENKASVVETNNKTEVKNNNKKKLIIGGAAAAAIASVVIGGILFSRGKGFKFVERSDEEGRKIIEKFTKKGDKLVETKTFHPDDDKTVKILKDHVNNVSTHFDERGTRILEKTTNPDGKVIVKYFDDSGQNVELTEERIGKVVRKSTEHHPNGTETVKLFDENGKEIIDEVALKQKEAIEVLKKFNLTGYEVFDDESLVKIANSENFDLEVFKNLSKYQVVGEKPFWGSYELEHLSPNFKKNFDDKLMGEIFKKASIVDDGDNFKYPAKSIIKMFELDNFDPEKAKQMFSLGFSPDQIKSIHENGLNKFDADFVKEVLKKEYKWTKEDGTERTWKGFYDPKKITSLLIQSNYDQDIFRRIVNLTEKDGHPMISRAGIEYLGNIFSEFSDENKIMLLNHLVKSAENKPSDILVDFSFLIDEIFCGAVKNIEELEKAFVTW